MANFPVTRYYGEVTHEDNKHTFHVYCLVPPRASIYEYEGHPDSQLSRMLCVDDFILASVNWTVDWSPLRNRIPYRRFS